jgi:hypothetical protein
VSARKVRVPRLKTFRARVEIEVCRFVTVEAETAKQAQKLIEQDFGDHDVDSEMINSFSFMELPREVKT